MTWKRLATSAVLAGTFLAAPADPSAGILDLGAGDAFAASCRLKIEVCSEINLYVWKGTVCVEYCVD